MKKIILITAISAICTQAQSQWSLTGNAGTNSTSNFIGTTDNVNFKIRTKNVVRVTVTAGGKVGIGNTAPVFKLDVKGGSINTDSVYRIGGNTVLSVIGSNNLFAGQGSGFSLTSGGFNTACGRDALYFNNTGSGNTASGFRALYSNSTGSLNTANGYQSLFANTTGHDNTASGMEALRFNTTGIFNTAHGSQSLYKNTVGENNTANGYQSLYENTTGDNNTASGVYALYANTTGFSNTATGVDALVVNTTGFQNTSNGFSSLFSNTTGNQNTACGMQALYSNTTASSNTALGGSALYSNTTGTLNTATGRSALFENTTGSNNTASGYNSLFNTNASFNTAIGYLAGDNFANAYFNVFLGAETDVNGTGYSNVIAIGEATICTASNQATMGNSVTNSYRAYANWSNISDGRYKKNVKENVPGIEFINKLRPVTYNLDARGLDNFMHKNSNSRDQWDASAKGIYEQAVKEKEKIKYSGFIAQEVEAAAKELGFDFSGVDAAKNENDVYGLRYAEFVVPLVKAVQELNEKLEIQNAELKSEVRSQKLEIEMIKSVLSEEQQLKLKGMNNEKFSRSGDSEQLLFQNTPNPFSDKTIISYNIPASAQHAELKIYDTDGAELKSIPVSSKGPGQIAISGKTLAAGTYTYMLLVDGKVADSKQMVLTK